MMHVLRGLLLLCTALLCGSLSAIAQSPEWKAVSCTVEAPESMQGEVLTFYFTETGQVRYRDALHRGTVTSPEVHFCWSIESTEGKPPGRSCFTISRIS